MFKKYYKIKQFIQSYKFVCSDYVNHILNINTIPYHRDDNDLFIVEFPKSGITWLSFLLTNSLFMTFGINRKATFFNIDDFVMDVHVRRRAKTRPIGEFDSRLIKSHSSFNPCYKKVIYLIRDPRDVMLSYYRFLTDLSWYKGSFEEMLIHPRFGVKSWADHVDGWITNVSPSSKCIIVKYEDLLLDTEREVKEIFELFGIVKNDAVIKEAIKRSSLEYMRMSEDKFKQKSANMTKLSFVRKESKENFLKTSSPVLNDIIIREAGHVMQKFGYI